MSNLHITDFPGAKTTGFGTIKILFGFMLLPSVKFEYIVTSPFDLIVKLPDVNKPFGHKPIIFK